MVPTKLVEKIAKDFDLTDFPVPAFHLLDMSKYSYEILGNHFCLFELGRGCNFGCKFCNRIMYEPKLRTKTLAQVCNEIKIAVERHGVRTAYFMDLEFLAYKHLVRGVCDFLSKQKWRLKWCCQTRADSLDKDILKMMKAAGCQLIHIGVEGGIQKYRTAARGGVSPVQGGRDQNARLLHVRFPRGDRR